MWKGAATLTMGDIDADAADIDTGNLTINLDNAFNFDASSDLNVVGDLAITTDGTGSAHSLTASSIAVSGNASFTDTSGDDDVDLTNSTVTVGGDLSLTQGTGTNTGTLTLNATVLDVEGAATLTMGDIDADAADIDTGNLTVNLDNAFNFDASSDLNVVGDLAITTDGTGSAHGLTASSIAVSGNVSFTDTSGDDDVDLTNSTVTVGGDLSLTQGTGTNTGTLTLNATVLDVEGVATLTMGDIDADAVDIDTGDLTVNLDIAFNWTPQLGFECGRHLAITTDGTGIIHSLTSSSIRSSGDFVFTDNSGNEIITVDSLTTTVGGDFSILSRQGGLRGSGVLTGSEATFAVTGDLTIETGRIDVTESTVSATNTTVLLDSDLDLGENTQLTVRGDWAVTTDGGALEHDLTDAVIAVTGNASFTDTSGDDDVDLTNSTVTVGGDLGLTQGTGTNTGTLILNATVLDVEGAATLTMGDIDADAADIDTGNLTINLDNAFNFDASSDLNVVGDLAITTDGTGSAHSLTASRIAVSGNASFTDTSGDDDVDLTNSTVTVGGDLSLTQGTGTNTGTLTLNATVLDVEGAATLTMGDIDADAADIDTGDLTISLDNNLNLNDQTDLNATGFVHVTTLGNGSLQLIRNSNVTTTGDFLVVEQSRNDTMNIINSVLTVGGDFAWLSDSLATDGEGVIEITDTRITAVGDMTLASGELTVTNSIWDLGTLDTAFSRSVDLVSAAITTQGNARVAADAYAFLTSDVAMNVGGDIEFAMTSIEGTRTSYEVRSNINANGNLYVVAGSGSDTYDISLMTLQLDGVARGQGGADIDSITYQYGINLNHQGFESAIPLNKRVVEVESGEVGEANSVAARDAVEFDAVAQVDRLDEAFDQSEQGRSTQVFSFEEILQTIESNIESNTSDNLQSDIPVADSVLTEVRRAVAEDNAQEALSPELIRLIDSLELPTEVETENRSAIEIVRELYDQLPESIRSQIDFNALEVDGSLDPFELLQRLLEQVESCWSLSWKKAKRTSRMSVHWK